jgi:hypothetical protein
MNGPFAYWSDCARGFTGERRERGHLERPNSVSRKALAAPYQPKRTNSCPSEKAKTNRCPQMIRNTRIATTPRRRRPRRRAEIGKARRQKNSGPLTHISAALAASGQRSDSLGSPTAQVPLFPRVTRIARWEASVSPRAFHPDAGGALF